MLVLYKAVPIPLLQVPRDSYSMYVLIRFIRDVINGAGSIKNAIYVHTYKGMGDGTGVMWKVCAKPRVGLTWLSYMLSRSEKQLHCSQLTALVTANILSDCIPMLLPQ